MRGGRGLFSVAYNVANVLNYVFLVAMSRLLDAEDFPLFAALFGAVYFASALANTVQTSVASAVAADDPGGGGAVMRCARPLVLGAPLIAAATLVAVRPAASLLRSDDVISTALVPFTIWIFLLASAGYGGLQGSARFGLLGTSLLGAAVIRLVLGVILVVAGLGVSGAMLGMAIGLAASAAFALRPFLRTTATSQLLVRPLGAEVLPSLVASLAIALPTSLDVILAQHVLPAPEAGAYAVVSVPAKTLLFVAMTVSILAYPSLVRLEAAREPSRKLRRGALLAVAAVAAPMAAAIVAAGMVLPELAFRGYDVSPGFLGAYTGAMLAFAIAATLLYHDLARRRGRRFVGLVLLVLLAELAVIASWHPGVTTMALVLLAGNAFLALAGVCVTQGRNAEEALRGPRLLQPGRAAVTRP